MSSLFACEDPATWRRVYEQYWDVVEARTKAKKPGKLLELDKWYQEELPALISSRPEKHVTLSELVKLMEWKLTRGKFRPRLQQLAASNSEDAVEKCSKKAFSLLPDVPAAIAELSSLKGVGPATASGSTLVTEGAWASKGGGEQTQAPKCLSCVPGVKPVQYTAKHYALYLGRMAERTAQLNKADPQQDWTPHRLELCLWALTTAAQQQLPLLKDIDVKGDGSAKSSESDTGKRPTKRLKTK